MSLNQQRQQHSCSCRREKKNFLHVTGDGVNLNIRGSLERLESCQNCCKKDKWTIKEFFSECENNPDCLIDLFRLNRIREKDEQEKSFTKNKYQNISETLSSKYEHKRENVKRTNNVFDPQKETRTHQTKPALDADKLKKALSDHLRQEEITVNYRKKDADRKKKIVVQEAAKDLTEDDDEDKNEDLKKYHYLMVDHAISCKVPSQEKLVKSSEQVKNSLEKLATVPEDITFGSSTTLLHLKNHLSRVSETYSGRFGRDRFIEEHSGNPKRSGSQFKERAFPKRRDNKYSTYTVRSERTKFNLGKKSIEMRGEQKKKNIVWEENLRRSTLPTAKQSLISNTSNSLYMLREAIKKDFDEKHIGYKAEAKAPLVKKKSIYRWFPCLTIFKKKKPKKKIVDGVATPLSVITIEVDMNKTAFEIYN